jgi:PAS domain S-box-containing protein
MAASERPSSAPTRTSPHEGTLRTKEQLKVELALRERLLESSRYAIAALGPDGLFTFANQRAYEITRYAHDELIGMSFADLVPPQRLPQVADHFAMAFSGDESVRDIETEIIRKDGTRVWISFNLAPTMSDGRVAGVVGWAEDVTHRRRRDALLASQHALLELAAGGRPFRSYSRRSPAP